MTTDLAAGLSERAEALPAGTAVPVPREILLELLAGHAGAVQTSAKAAQQDRPLMYRLTQAAKATGLSEDFLRRVPDLPKVVIRGAGAKDRRPVIGIMHEDLMAWLHRQRQS
jgi:hypothetical protein